MKLKHSLVLVGVAISVSSFAQETISPGYQPSFAAVIVKDIDLAVDWYRSVFSLTVRDRIGDANADNRVVILESPTFTLELLELKGSLAINDLLANKPEGTQLQGHFKIGFQVNDMNASLQQLAKLNVNVPRIYTDSKTKKRNFLITDPDGNLIQFFE